MKVNLYRKSTKLILILIATLLITASLANRLPYFWGDIEITRSLQSIQSPAFSNVMVWVSNIGNSHILGATIIGTLFIILLIGLKAEVIVTGLITLSTIIIGSLLKSLVNRPRPSPELVHTYESFSRKSFPSLHVLIFTVLFGYIFYLAFSRVTNIWIKSVILLSSTILISTIGISRIYLGAHWASDVLGGYLLATIILIISIQIDHRTKSKR